MPTARRSSLALVLLAVTACGGERTVTPKPVACAPDASAEPLQLPVGGVAVLSGNEAVGCVRLPAGASPSAYVVIAANASTASDADAVYQLVTSTGAAVATSAVDVAAVRRAVTSDAPSARHAVHDRLMARARELRATRPAAPLASRQPATSSGAVRRTIFTGTPVVGQVVTINAPGLAAGDNPCTVFTALRGRVMYVSERAVIVQDTTAPSDGFTSTDFQAIGSEFDDLIFRTDTTYFGSPTDADVNARIVIFYTPYVNKETPRQRDNPNAGVLAGFFWAGDLFPRRDCTQSNEGELFYLLVPDPTGIFSDPRAVGEVRERTRGTVAHEFEHMINAGVRLRTGASSFEDIWLDEALAHFAEEMVGRAKIGATDTEQLNFARVYDAANGFRDYDAFFYQNLARFDRWLRASGRASPTSEHADTSLAVRGAAWALLRYAADHHSGGSVRTFTRRLVAGPQVGVANLQARTNVPFDQTITRWLVANYADDAGIPNVAAMYTYPSWNMRNAVLETVRLRTPSTPGYTLQVTPLSGGQTIGNTVRSGAGWYYDLSLAAGSQVTSLAMQSATGGAAFPTARLVLLRRQ